MKLKDIITESNHFATNLSDFDATFNPEIARTNAKEKEKNQKRFKNGVAVQKTEKYDGRKFTNKPNEEGQPSAGYKGLQRINKRVGLPHDEEALNKNAGYTGPSSSDPVAHTKPFNRTLI